MNSFSSLVDFAQASPENKHVFFSHFLGDFHVGSVHRSDDQAPIHYEFHVGGAGSFHASGTYVLTQF
jgi:hypothetical protein